MIYLYKEQIEELFRKRQWILLLAAVISVVFYYTIGGNSMACLFVSAVFLICALPQSGGILDNNVAHFISGISMEIYLSHMVVFRVGEKLHLNTVLGNGWLQYAFTVLYVVIGAAVFAVVMQKIIETVKEKL